MAHRLAPDPQSLKATRLGAYAAIALASLVSTCVPQFAKADELEDMLARLMAAGSTPDGDGAITSIAVANGVVGAIVANSANGSQGIMALNQDAGPGGAMQANVVVVALSNGPSAAAIARLLAQQVYIEESAPPTEESVAGFPSVAALAIVDSYRNGTGIVQVNQNAGIGNVQRNATVIAAALGGGDASAINEPDLSSVGSLSRNSASPPGQRGHAVVSGSFTDFSGVAQVNQTIGSGNLVSNTVSFTYGGAPSGGG